MHGRALAFLEKQAAKSRKQVLAHLPHSTYHKSMEKVCGKEAVMALST